MNMHQMLQEYVHNMLKSFQTFTKAKHVIRKVKKFSTKGGFNLTKFTSNNEQVLKLIPDEEKGRMFQMKHKHLLNCQKIKLLE